MLPMGGSRRKPSLMREWLYYYCLSPYIEKQPCLIYRYPLAPLRQSDEAPLRQSDEAWITVYQARAGGPAPFCSCCASKRKCISEALLRGHSALQRTNRRLHPFPLLHSTYRRESIQTFNKMPRPSRPRSRRRRSRQDSDESPIAHRTRSRAPHQRRQEADPPRNRSRSPRDRDRVAEHLPAPPPAMELRGEVEVRCTICLLGYEPGEDTAILTCGHEFHMGCIQHWIEQSATCPLCRALIPIPQQDQQDQQDHGIRFFNIVIDGFEIQLDENEYALYFNMQHLMLHFQNFEEDDEDDEDDEYAYGW
ncbi:uncharacterized protein LOC143939376 [Lithobates pipiens]